MCIYKISFIEHNLSQAKQNRDLLIVLLTFLQKNSGKLFLLSYFSHCCRTASNYWAILGTTLFSWLMSLLYVKTHVWTGVCVARLTSSASCNWWWLCYMSKHTCEQVLVLSSTCLVYPTADDGFAICRNACVDRCMCCKDNV